MTPVDREGIIIKKYDTAFTYITLNPNVSSSKIYLSSIAVPLTADKVLVCVEVGTGTMTSQDKLRFTQ